MIENIFFIAGFTVDLMIIITMMLAGWNKAIIIITSFAVGLVLMLGHLKWCDICEEIKKETGRIPRRIMKKISLIQSLQDDLAFYFKEENKLCMHVFPDCIGFTSEPKGKEIYENVFFESAFSALDGFLYIKISFNKYLKLHIFL